MRLKKGLREIATGSPYQRAVAGDQVTAGLFDTIGRAGTTPDFYGPREPTGSQPPQMMGLEPTTPDGVQYDPSKIVPNTTGQRLVGDDRMREIMSLSDDRSRNGKLF